MPRPSVRVAAGLLIALAISFRFDRARAQEQSTPHLSAMWGQTVSSQLMEETPVSYWNVAMSVPVVSSIGLGAQFRFDSVVFGEPGNLLSQAIHPGRTDYNLAVWVIPPRLRVGVEMHHVSSHAVEPLHKGSPAAFEETINVGGASNFLSFLYRSGGVEARLGLGSVWADTNTAPILLGIDAVLLNSRISEGPFATLRVPYRWGKLRGRAGVVYMHDLEDHGRVEGDMLAWGASVQWPVASRLGLGAGYAGNNGVPDVKRSDNIVSLFLKLHWAEK